MQTRELQLNIEPILLELIALPLSMLEVHLDSFFSCLQLLVAARLAIHEAKNDPKFDHLDLELEVGNGEAILQVLSFSAISRQEANATPIAVAIGT